MLYALQGLPEAMEVLSVKNVTVVGLLLLFCYYFYSENKTLKKDVKELIKNHQDDLKEHSKDLRDVSDKWNSVFAQLKEIVGRR